MTAAADIAAAAQAAVSARLAAYAEVPGTGSRRGEGWLAVRTGVRSNEDNGVVSEAGVAVPRPEVERLVAWFAEVGAPASWWTAQATAELTDTLVAAGARPERTGNWSGCALPLQPAARSSTVAVVPLSSERDLDDWLDVADACDWLDGDADRTARRRLYLALGFEHPDLTHWVARDDERTVGFASTFRHGDVVDLWNLGVHPTARRRGIGRAIVLEVLDVARRRGALRVVSAPSPDGWQLQRTLGFSTVPVEPDTTFYLPSL